jgi:hypothetical protein
MNGDERELRFVEDDVSRGDHLASGEVEASVPLVVWWIAQKSTWYRACTELVLSGRRHVGEAEAPEDAQIIIGWCCTKQQLKWRHSTCSSTWPAIK